MTSRPSTTAASAALSAGTMTPRRPSRWASIAVASAPLTARTRPSSASSPSEQVLAHLLAREQPPGHGDGQGDRQVEGGRVLPHVGRGEVDGDLGPRPAVAAVAERRLDPRDALLHRRLRQAHQLQLAHPAGSDVGLDLATDRVDPLQNGRMDFSDHLWPFSVPQPIGSCGAPSEFAGGRAECKDTLSGQGPSLAKWWLHYRHWRRRWARPCLA